MNTLIPDLLHSYCTLINMFMNIEKHADISGLYLCIDTARKKEKAAVIDNYSQSPHSE